MTGARVLLTEGSSLTSREVVTCLGPAGYHLEVLDPDPFGMPQPRWRAVASQDDLADFPSRIG